MLKELIDIQSNLVATKSQYNKFGNYNYRSAEDILEAVKPLLKEHGCVLTLTDAVTVVGEKLYVMATATIKKGEEQESVTAYAREAENAKGMSEPQLTGSASSYARKYALNGLFLIDDNKDPDTNEFKNENDKKKKKEEPNFDKELSETIDKSKAQVLSQFIKSLDMSTEDALAELGVSRLGEVTREKYAKFFKDHEAKEDQKTLEV